MNHGPLLSDYRRFVERTIKNYTSDYRSYVQAGGAEPFFQRCWWLMMNETVEEASRLSENYFGASTEKINLLHQLQAIATECLLEVYVPAEQSKPVL